MFITTMLQPVAAAPTRSWGCTFCGRASTNVTKVSNGAWSLGVS